MGIDTYHDPRHREPSVVGVVASMNQALTRSVSRCWASLFGRSPVVIVNSSLFSRYLSVPLRQQTTKNEVAEALHSCMKVSREWATSSWGSAGPRPGSESLTLKYISPSSLFPQPILEQFVMMNGNLPEYVCVFRDGVGEGQLQVGAYSSLILLRRRSA